MTHATDVVLSAIVLLFGLVLAGVGVIDGFLSSLMTAAGVNPDVQMIILVCVAVLLVIAAGARPGCGIRDAGRDPAGAAAVAPHGAGFAGATSRAAGGRRFRPGASVALTFDFNFRWRD